MLATGDSCSPERSCCTGTSDSGRTSGLASAEATGLAYELTCAGDLVVDQFRGALAGRVSGAFEATALHFIAFHVDWKL